MMGTGRSLMETGGRVCAMALLALGLGSCASDSAKEPPPANIPAADPTLQYPDLSVMPKDVTVTPAEVRKEVLETLQNDALRASLSRDVVSLDLSAQIPQPLRVPIDPLIPAEMRLEPEEARSRLAPPPPAPDPSQMPPSRPAGK